MYMQIDESGRSPYRNGLDAASGFHLVCHQSAPYHPALQNAAPDGPSAYIIGDVMDRSLRWTEGGSAAFLHRCLGLSRAIYESIHFALHASLAQWLENKLVRQHVCALLPSCFQQGEGSSILPCPRRRVLGSGHIHRHDAQRHRGEARLLPVLGLEATRGAPVTALELLLLLIVGAKFWILKSLSQAEMTLSSSEAFACRCAGEMGERAQGAVCCQGPP